MTIYPVHWPRHGSERACHEGDCHRCLLEENWDEEHEDCHCLDKPWHRSNIGTPAVSDLQWLCSVCLRVMGPAYVGGVA